MVKYIRTIDHATSVKKISIIVDPTATKTGVSDFKANPVFSVFDIGTIKPPIPLDNSTITLMGGFNFELLRGAGVPNHYSGLVDDQGKNISAHEAIKEKYHPTTMRVQMVNRLAPKHTGEEWNYDIFQNPPANNYVIPIECITRNALPESSSIWKRIEKELLTLTDLGLPETLQKGDDIPKDKIPLLDYSTKFEPDDRPLTADEAKQLSGLTDDQFSELQRLQRKASNVMTDYASSIGFNRKDGKVEFIIYEVQGVKYLCLADAVCTWHEDRLVTPQGIGISKQRIRDEVEHYNPKWYADINLSKQKAKDERHADFRDLMDKSIKYTSPPAEFFQAINTLFQAGTNVWVQSKVYDVFPGKDDSLEDQLTRAVELFQETQQAKK